MSETNRNYECPTCGYVSDKTHLEFFQGEELRFCEKCYIDFLKLNVPQVIEIPTE